MSDLKELKLEINEIDKQLEGVLEYTDRAVLLAKRNSKAREFNRKKKFWQLNINIRQ